MPARLGGLWTTVVNAREMQRGSRQQLMREIANCESIRPPLDRQVAARRPGTWTTLAPPCLRGPASWPRPGLPARTALSKEVPILPLAEHTRVVRVHLPETDSLPKMPNRPLLPISQRFEGPTLLLGKVTAPPLKPHHRGPPLQGCLKGTPAIVCRGPDRIETPQTVASCEGCGLPWGWHTSRGATTRSVRLGRLELD